MYATIRQLCGREWMSEWVFAAAVVVFVDFGSEFQYIRPIFEWTSEQDYFYFDIFAFFYFFFLIAIDIEYRK